MLTDRCADRAQTVLRTDRAQRLYGEGFGLPGDAEEGVLVLHGARHGYIGFVHEYGGLPSLGGPFGAPEVVEVAMGGDDRDRLRL